MASSIIQQNHSNAKVKYQIKLKLNKGYSNLSLNLYYKTDESLRYC